MDGRRTAATSSCRCRRGRPGRPRRRRRRPASRAAWTSRVLLEMGKRGATPRPERGLPGLGGAAGGGNGEQVARALQLAFEHGLHRGVLLVRIARCPDWGSGWPEYATAGYAGKGQVPRGPRTLRGEKAALRLGPCANVTFGVRRGPPHPIEGAAPGVPERRPARRVAGRSCRALVLWCRGEPRVTAQSPSRPARSPVPRFSMPSSGTRSSEVTPRPSARSSP